MDMRKIISIFIGICLLSVYFHHHENEGINDENIKFSISHTTEKLYIFTNQNAKLIAGEECAICNFLNTSHLFYFNSHIILYSHIFTTPKVIGKESFTDNLLFNLSITRAPPVFS